MENKGPVQSHPNPWNFLVTKKATPAIEVMIKRELFATMAMQEILSDQSYNETPSRMAASCVRAADAILAELAKGTEPCDKA